MYRFHVPDMTCAHCVRTITDAVHQVDPAADVTADPSTHAVTVRSTADQPALLAALSEAGYDAQPQG